MRVKERFDKRAAAALVLIRSETEPALEAYVKAGTIVSEGVGECEVEYTTRGLGRFVARRVADGGHYSYMTMWGESRACLASSYYVDVDMENSHPRLASQAFASHGIKHGHLREYVENREARLEEVARTCGVERWQAKKLFLSQCFGGTVRAWAAEHGVDAQGLPAYVDNL
jgi:hypothetical protein